jgi:nucleotide-binding universal stress UspA family protein
VFTDILVAVDASKHADLALSEAIDLASQSGGSLTLATVVPEPSVAAVGGGFAPFDYPDLYRNLNEEYQGVLDAAEAKVPAEISSRALLLEGHPARAIVNEVKSGGHDLVVIGSRGLGGLGSMILGSVSREVLHGSPVPVLVIHLADDSKA